MQGFCNKSTQINCCRLKIKLREKSSSVNHKTRVIVTRRQWQLEHLHSEPTGRLRENQNKENEICSRMKCVAVAVKPLTSGVQLNKPAAESFKF